MDLIPDFIKNNSLLSSADSNLIAHLAHTIENRLWRNLTPAVTPRNETNSRLT